jgi:ABC-2 type transport system permease protein
MMALRDNLPLLWRQIRSQNRTFWRTPVAAFFTLALPVFFLVLFSVIFGSDEIADGYRFSQFFAPAMAVFASVSATFTSLSIGTALARDQGILKRVRGTPLPPWVYMAGRIGSGVWIAMISVVVMFAVGWAFFGFVLIWSDFGVAVLVFILGMATFSALGLSVCALVKNGDSVPAVANAVFLPMAFISGIFIPLEDAPPWLVLLGDIFPLKHFAEPFGAAFDPFSDAPVLAWENLAVMGVWLALGLLITTRFFSWDPRGSR